MFKSNAKSQTELVDEALANKGGKKFTEITEKLSLPGVTSLHLKSFDEIGAFLSNILKSRRGIKSITYRVGEYIEITSDSDSGMF